MRHRKACAIKNGGKRCSCEPGFFVRIRVDGQRVSEMFDTLDEAEAFIEQERGGPPARPIGVLGVTVRDLGDELIEDMRTGRILNRSGLPYKPSLCRDFERDLEASIYPLIGDMRVADLRPKTIEGLIQQLAAQGRRDPKNPSSTEPLSASTIRNRLKPLAKIVNIARLRGILESDPFGPVTLPSAGGYRDRVVPHADVRRMYEVIEDPVVRCAWAIFLLTGMRLGEALALRWKDVSIDSLNVEASWTSTRDHKGRVAPKTRRSKRKVPLSGLLRAELDTLRAYRHGQGLAEDEDWLILHGENPLRPISAQTISRKARESWAEAGLEAYTPHEARHTYVSSSIASGRSIERVAREVGDSHAMIERRYRHLVPGEMADAADEIDRLFGA